MYNIQQEGISLTEDQQCKLLVILLLFAFSINSRDYPSLRHPLMSHVTTRSPYIVYTKRKQFNYRTLNEYIAQCIIFSKSSHLTKKIPPCMSVPRAAKLYFRMCKIIEIVLSLSVHRCHNSVTNVKITYIRPWTTRPCCLVKATVVYIIFKRPVNFSSGHFHNKPYLGSRVAPRVRPKGNPSTCLMHCPAEVTYNEKLAA